MKKIILYISITSAFFSCNDELESEFHIVETEALYQSWEVESIEFLSSNENFNLPIFNSNTLQLNKGGTYNLVSDEDNVIQLFSANPEIGIWEFPVEASPTQILFDKGVSTYDEFLFYDSWLYYRIAESPIHLFNYKLINNNRVLRLTTDSYEKIYNYGIRYYYDYLYDQFYVYPSSTYEEGIIWGEEIGYFMGISDAADESISLGYNILEDNAFMISIGDAAYEYDYDYEIFSYIASNAEFERGFYEGFDRGYEEGSSYNFAPVNVNNMPSLILNFKKK